MPSGDYYTRIVGTLEDFKLPVTPDFVGHSLFMCNESADVFYKGKCVWGGGKCQNYGSLGGQESDGCSVSHPPPKGG